MAQEAVPVSRRRARAAGAGAAGARAPAGRRIPPALYFGLTVASFGGPLALVGLYVPQALDGAGSSAALVGILSVLFFLLPLLIWYRYSEAIVSNGGLYAFVQAAVGRPLALTQAGFWIVSYFLYLVYTVPFIAYDLLPAVSPQLTAYRLPIDILLALAIAGMMLCPLIVAVSALAAIGAVQSIGAVILVAATYSHFGAPASAFIGHGNFGSILRASGATASLYICGSLPLFLGGEVEGGSQTIRRSLAWGFAVVGGLVVVATVPLVVVRTSILGGDLPGVPLAQTTAGSAAALMVGIGICVSVGGLILAEFLALTRLVSTAFNQAQRRVVFAVVAAFLLASLLALLDPQRAYDLLLRPSLIALWISQLLVVVVYPIFSARRGRITPGVIGLAAGASALMLFALFGAVTDTAGT